VLDCSTAIVGVRRMAKKPALDTVVKRGVDHCHRLVRRALS
jgi:hypothetical protein